MSAWDLLRLQQRAYLLERDIRNEAEALEALEETLRSVERPHAPPNPGGRFLPPLSGRGYRVPGRECDQLADRYGHAAPAETVTTGVDGRAFVPFPATSPTFTGHLVSVPAGYRLSTSRYADFQTHAGSTS